MRRTLEDWEISDNAIWEAAIDSRDVETNPVRTLWRNVFIGLALTILLALLIVAVAT